MSGRIVRWAILVALFLAVCTGTGIAVKTVVRPQERDYRTYYSPPRSNPSTQPAFNPPVNVTKGAQDFPPLRVATPVEAFNGVQLIEQLQQAHRAAINGNDWQFFRLVSTHRMAEEWIRFGVCEFSGDTPTGSTLGDHASTIQSELRQRILADTKTFRASDVSVLGVTQDPTNGDTIVLTKHVARENGRTATWCTRWWFTIGPSGGSLYDYEEQPHRLRVNAILASDFIQMTSAVQTRSLLTVANTRSITDRTTEFMQTGTVAFQLPVPNEVLRLITPMEVMRRAMIASTANPSRSAIVRKLTNDGRPWPDIAPLALMLASSGDIRAIQAFRASYGEHPIADLAEARIADAAGQSERARDVLEQSLTANSGEPMLLAALYGHRKESERGTLGTQAAQGNAPSAAIRRLVAEHLHERTAIAAIVNAYRALLPNEPDGILAEALLAADRSDFAEARKMIEFLMAETPSGTHAEWRERFLKLYSAKLGKMKSDILTDQLLGPLFRD